MIKLQVLFFTFFLMSYCLGEMNKKLPEKLIVGYANWGQCDQTIVKAVAEGVNVLIWFSINLVKDPITGGPSIQGGPDMSCVAEIVKEIKERHLDCIHLISIGGWNSPHPDTTNTAEDIFANLNYWNRQVISQPDNDFFGFEGFDWDIEGNDNPASPFNTFTIDCLDIMGKISQLAKQHGYIFSMAPAESYLDPSTSMFDLNLTHNYPEWELLQPEFTYHGHNIYAFLLAKYGKTIISYQDQSYVIDTFDFITIQLYEGFSHASYILNILNYPFCDFLHKFVNSFYNGWLINFDAVPDVGVKTQMISVDKTKLVVGLANGWAGTEKFLLVYPDLIEKSHIFLEKKGEEPRGYAFWNIKDEGLASESDPNRPIWMAKGLNSFLHIHHSF